MVLFGIVSDGTWTPVPDGTWISNESTSADALLLIGAYNGREFAAVRRLTGLPSLGPILGTVARGPADQLDARDTPRRARRDVDIE